MIASGIKSAWFLNDIWTHCGVHSTKSGLTVRVHHQWSSVLIVKPQWVAWKFSDPACRRYLVNCALSSTSTARTTERDDRMDCCFCSLDAGDCNLCWEALIELFKQIKVTPQSWHVTCAAKKKKKALLSVALMTPPIGYIFHGSVCCFFFIFMTFAISHIVN